MHVRTSFLCVLFYGVLSVAAAAAANSSEHDELLGAWTYKNDQGRAVSMVLVHLCESIPEHGDVCHVEVANYTPGKPPGFKRVLVHLAISRAALKESVIARPKKELRFYPEGHASAFQHWKYEAAQGRFDICEHELNRCIQERSGKS